MLFSVVERHTRLTPISFPKVYLVNDTWDDYNFRTYWGLFVFDEDGVKHELGGVKIGQFGLTKQQRRPVLPPEFDSLDNSYFSLGQKDSYYLNIGALSDTLKGRILHGLNDVALDLELFNKALEEEVTKVSLLRWVSILNVREQFHRLISGGAKLTAYNFTYKAFSPNGEENSLSLHFEVEPESTPPTNIHVLIGRNGVGKTYTLNNMARSLVETAPSTDGIGTFVSGNTTSSIELFANVVSVSFSAFDNFEPIQEREDKSLTLRYSYVGLKRFVKPGEVVDALMTPQLLMSELVSSLSACISGFKDEQWRTSMQMLETDPLFRGADVASKLPSRSGTTFSQSQIRSISESVGEVFDHLSSGHKIVLLTMTKLVELVDERTLVLIDEPEAHLHPPLLSSFIRALSALLMYRNGVAIIATHSPVILQEVPRSCVWKLRREGTEARADRPEIETFGENVGVLTREVFGLEVTNSGFHQMLQEVVQTNQSYERTLQVFNGELGGEAKAILRSLITLRDLDQEV